MQLCLFAKSSPFTIHAFARLALATFLVSFLVDMPRVLNMPTRVYLPRGMLGKIECTVDANPPVTLIIWTKNDRILDVSPANRVRTNKQGVLIINPVVVADEGRYCCTPYSPMGAGQVSMPVQVFVKGKYVPSVLFVQMQFVRCVVEIESFQVIQHNNNELL